MRTQMMAMPKFVTPPPPNIQAKQPKRFTTSVALLTVRTQQQQQKSNIDAKEKALKNTCLIHKHA